MTGFEERPSSAARSLGWTKANSAATAVSNRVVRAAKGAFTFSVYRVQEHTAVGEQVIERSAQGNRGSFGGQRRNGLGEDGDQSSVAGQGNKAVGGVETEEAARPVAEAGRAAIL